MSLPWQNPIAASLTGQLSSAQLGSVPVLIVLDPLWGFVRGHGGTAELQLGHSSSQEHQYAGEDLQAVGEPGQTQRPAERGANVGQTLRPHQPLGLSQGLVWVDDVEADATQGQQT